MQTENSDFGVKQEEDGNASDDDHQMVICEDPQPDTDLKAKSKAADNGIEMQQEENTDNNFNQSRYSPVSGQNREGQNMNTEITCRPKPIKGINYYIY